MIPDKGGFARQATRTCLGRSSEVIAAELMKVCCRWEIKDDMSRDPRRAKKVLCPAVQYPEVQLEVVRWAEHAEHSKMRVTS